MTYTFEEEITQKVTKTVKPSDVYQTGDIEDRVKKLLEKHQVLEFRPVKCGEGFISTGGDIVKYSTFDFDKSEPRFIVKSSAPTLWE